MIEDPPWFILKSIFSLLVGSLVIALVILIRTGKDKMRGR